MLNTSFFDLDIEWRMSTGITSLTEQLKVVHGHRQNQPPTDVDWLNILMPAFELLQMMWKEKAAIDQEEIRHLQAASKDGKAA